VGRFEVTRDQFEAYAAVGAPVAESCWTFEGNQPQQRQGRSFRNPGHAQTGGHPAVCVNWSEAKAYVEWLSRRTGRSYRLLTEQEWDYAASGGPGAPVVAASELCQTANAADQFAKAANLPSNWTYLPCNDGFAYTAPVGRFKPNGFGLFDMTGNAWEWTQDCPQAAQTAGASCAQRVVRGGSWYGNAAMIGSAGRADAPADGRFDDVGLRVAREMTP
jgi:formylglycine-generating enzyme required for sulfatase activity